MIAKLTHTTLGQIGSNFHWASPRKDRNGVDDQLGGVLKFFKSWERNHPLETTSLMLICLFDLIRNHLSLICVWNHTLLCLVISWFSCGSSLSLSSLPLVFQWVCPLVSSAAQTPMMNVSFPPWPPKWMVHLCDFAIFFRKKSYVVIVG